MEEEQNTNDPKVFNIRMPVKKQLQLSKQKEEKEKIEVK